MQLRIIISVCFFLLINFQSSAQELRLPVSTQAVSGYRLIWEDHFDGDSLNTKYWNVCINGHGGGNRELQYYRKENVTVGKEPSTGLKCLIITAKRDSYKSFNFSSGKITSEDKLAIKYGKIEACIKLPSTANGLWPAFWMLGANHGETVWPKCGEIDILEMGHKNGIAAGTQDKLFNGACHWGESWNGGKYPNKAMFATNQYSLQDGFHLYTLLWTKDSIKMYLDLDKCPDVKPYFEMPIVGNQLPNQTSRYFRKPFYLIFNLAVGGTFSEIYDAGQITALKDRDAKMYVDYIKVYVQNDGLSLLKLNK